MTTMNTKMHPATVAANKRKADAFNDLLARFPGLKAALDKNPDLGMNHFRDDVAHKITTNPAKATDRMVTAFINAVEKDAKFLAARADRLAAAEVMKANALAAGVTAPTGRVMVTGTVVHTKFVPNKFGGAHKMMVDLGNGAKVWTTIPTDLVNWAHDLEFRALGGAAPGVALLKGAKVTVTATFVHADNDPLFAFGTRPTVNIDANGPAALDALNTLAARAEAAHARIHNDLN